MPTYGLSTIPLGWSHSKHTQNYIIWYRNSTLHAISEFLLNIRTTQLSLLDTSKDELSDKYDKLNEFKGGLGMLHELWNELDKFSELIDNFS